MDYLDLDADNDGIPDTIEARATAGYVLNDGDVRNNDADDDGIINIFDSNDGTTKVFGGSFVKPVNTDASALVGSDALPDYLDTDADADTILDSNESGLSGFPDDLNGDGIRDEVFASYADPDGNANDPASNLANEVGNTTEVAYREYKDTDGDRVADTLDIDDDNDGILDTAELPTPDGTLDTTWNYSGASQVVSIQDAALIASVSPETLGSGLSDQGISLGGHFVASVAAGTNLQSAIGGNKYLEYGFSTAAAAEGKVIERLTFLRNATSYTVAVAISADGFLTAPNIIVRDVVLAGGSTVQTILTTESFALVGNTAYKIRLYVYDRSSASTNIKVGPMRFGLGPNRDTDGDSEANSVDLDSDNDGISDLFESTGGTGAALNDTNKDGTISAADAASANLDANGDGLMDIFGAGTTPKNTDGDAVADYIDLDSDNDGIADTVEARATAGFVANDGDLRDNDKDNDGVVNLFDSNDGSTKVFGGSFNTPVNTDALFAVGSDATPDYLDTDSDGDGKLDSAESGLSLVATDANGDGIRDSVGASYKDPEGIVSNPQTALTNETSTTAEVGYREVNIAPLAVNDTVSVKEDESLVLSLLANDTDANGDTLSYKTIAGVAITAGTAQSITVPNLSLIHI